MNSAVHEEGMHNCISSYYSTYNTRRLYSNPDIDLSVSMLLVGLRFRTLDPGVLEELSLVDVVTYFLQYPNSCVSGLQFIHRFDCTVLCVIACVHVSCIVEELDGVVPLILLGACSGQECRGERERVAAQPVLVASHAEVESSRDGKWSPGHTQLDVWVPVP